MSDTDIVALQPGDVLASKYRVDRVLGVGGMGVVIQATHVDLDERVALKFVLPQATASAEVTGRFLREARLAVKLKSEHVAKVMDVGTLESGSPYIVMEYLEGTDLDHLLETHGPLPFADVAEYVIQACDALAEAHAMGIVHRDIKPANLFLARRADGAPLVKVLDFGISKTNQLGEAAGAMTKTSAVMGSPHFMSPEQMRSSKDVDSRSDVWSMGVVLYQLLTARLPFESESLGGVMAAVLQDDPSMLCAYRPDVPHAFEAIVRRCLQRDRNARAQSVAEIAVTLAPYAPGRARPIADRIVSLIGGAGPSKGAMVLGAAPPVLGAAPGLDGGASMVTAGAPRRTGRRRAGVLGALAAGLAIVAGGFFWQRGAHRASAEPAARTLPTSDVARTTAAATVPAAPPDTATPIVEVGPSATAAEVAPRADRGRATGPVTARGARPAGPAPRTPAAIAATATPSGLPPGRSRGVLDDRN